MKAIGSATYMGFMGVRICTKEDKGFCLIGLWYITNRVQYNTVQSSSNNIRKKSLNASNPLSHWGMIHN